MVAHYYLFSCLKLNNFQSILRCFSECRSDAFGDIFSSKEENFILSEDKMGVSSVSLEKHKKETYENYEIFLFDLFNQ